MFSKVVILVKKKLFLIGFLLISPFGFGQLFEIDYTQGKREESNFRIQLIRTGIVGVSSIKHVDITIEAAKFQYDGKNGNHFAFTLYGTQTLWRGNRVDALNTFDFLMHPIGGTINGNFFFSFPLSQRQLQHTKIALSVGKKWIQGQPLPHFQSTSFFDNYSRLGWVYQKTLADDALTNSSLYFWTFPSLIAHQSTEKSRTQFFNDQLSPFAFGYALELGLEYNTQLKITLIGQQLLNNDPEGDFGRFVTRLIVGYRF